MKRNALPRLARDEHGMTLIETMVALAISIIVVSSVVVALFQLNDITRQQQDTLTVEQQLQNVAGILNRDILSAASGSVEGSSLTLQVVAYSFGEDSDPVTTTVTYGLSSGNLVRQVASDQVTVARHVTDLDFGPDGEIASTLPVTVTTTFRGRSRSNALVFYRRSSN